MRIGINPAKGTGRVADPGFCRVVVPVYIPQTTGYFAQSLQVVQLCLESLHLTSGENVRVTAVSNGCAAEVVEALERMFSLGWVDQLVLSQWNLGKTGAIASIIKGTLEPLVAWTDCDVLFKPGWFDSVIQVFKAFPECGAVTPFPAVHLAWDHTSATSLGAFACRCLRRAGVVSLNDLQAYAQSVGTPALFKDEHKHSQWLVQRGPVEACVGAMHFVCCIRREVLPGMPTQASTAALKAEADNNYLDLPPERLGLWRLSTVRSHVWHMGNTVEPWMIDHLDRLRKRPGTGRVQHMALPSLKPSLVSTLPLGARRLGARILRRVLERSVCKTLMSRLARSPQALP